MPKYILGLSAYYHDSAAAILKDGEVIAAAQEERFTRKKFDASFPSQSVHYCLSEAGISMKDVSCVAFYDKPFLKFERLLETYHAFAPRGLRSFAKVMPVWIKQKLFMKQILKKELGPDCPEILFPEHHLSHAASCFYPSPFEEAAILTIDGVGEWATTTLGKGSNRGIEFFKELHFPHSLGLFYSAFTYYCGFKVNNGEYKLMGLAPYGAKSELAPKLKKLILDDMIDVRSDGSLLLNMKYFDFATEFTMSNDSKWEKLLGFSRRQPESELPEVYKALAFAAQEITEEIVLKLAKTCHELSGSENLVMAGGVALNCVANGKIVKEGIFKNIWIQPAAGDSGGALGAALAAWHIGKGEPRRLKGDQMKAGLLGPHFEHFDQLLKTHSGKQFENYDELCEKVATLLSNGHVVGWFQGRMEYGPRALGNRSILADARHPEMQKRVNLKVKFREGFRPFAPSVLEEETQKYFDLSCESPYMLLVSEVKTKNLPAITHVDLSARIQTVSQKENPRYWKLIKKFEEKTGCAVILNTSMNVRGEPMVCTPDEAMNCFLKTDIDALVVEDYLFLKSK